MNWEAIGAIGEVVGGVAVIATLNVPVIWHRLLQVVERDVSRDTTRQDCVLDIRGQGADGLG